MGMPLVMLGSDYSRQHIRFGAETDAGFVGPPRSLMNTALTAKPGSIDWNNAFQTILTGGISLAKEFLQKSSSVAATDEDKYIIQQAAASQGITLSQATPYLVGGGALLVVVILLMSKRRR